MTCSHDFLIIHGMSRKSTNLGHTSEHTFALLGRYGDLVGMLLVNICDASDTAELLELGYRAHAHNLLIVVRHPQRNGIAPVAIARYGPVASIRQPIGESLLFGKLGHPVGLVVVLEQTLFEVLDFDEPATSN